MRKLIVKTIFITCGISLMLLFALFGIMSLWAPAAMMNFTASLGMETVSGDYAFQEYERSGSMSCLTRSFLIAAQYKDDRNAEQRFVILYGTDDGADEVGAARRERFIAYCAEQDETPPNGLPVATYRSYLCGQAAMVRYRLARTQEEKNAVCDFAIRETDLTFPAGNPVISLTIALSDGKDTATRDYLIAKLSEKQFVENADYRNIIKILEAVE